MARDRQRAKQRQAERRARRLADQERGGSEPESQAPVESRRGAEPAVEDPRAAPPAPGIDPGLAVGAPPTDLGRSGEVLEDEPDLIESEDGAAAEAEAADAAEYAPRGRRGGEAEAPSRSRVVQFLVAVWAELQRVQWPDRQALTTLTGVVLGFVLIAGGYLGLLDAIVSRLIKAIL